MQKWNGICLVDSVCKNANLMYSYCADGTTTACPSNRQVLPRESNELPYATNRKTNIP